MFNGHQFEERKRSHKKIEAALEYKPPSNRSRTKCLKIKIVAAAFIKKIRYLHC